MAYLEHAPAPREKEDAQVVERNARYGILLFLVYLFFYGGFIALSAFAPTIMASRPFGGVNTAILYGFGLIISALLLAFVYMFLCQAASPGSKPEGPS